MPGPTRIILKCPEGENVLCKCKYSAKRLASIFKTTRKRNRKLWRKQSQTLVYSHDKNGGRSLVRSDVPTHHFQPDPTGCHDYVLCAAAGILLFPLVHHPKHATYYAFLHSAAASIDSPTASRVSEMTGDFPNYAAANIRFQTHPKHVGTQQTPNPHSCRVRRE